jgi:hypothetical protein
MPVAWGWIGGTRRGRTNRGVSGRFAASAVRMKLSFKSNSMFDRAREAHRRGSGARLPAGSNPCNNGVSCCITIGPGTSYRRGSSRCLSLQVGVLHRNASTQKWRVQCSWPWLPHRLPFWPTARMSVCCCASGQHTLSRHARTRTRTRTRARTRARARTVAHAHAHARTRARAHTRTDAHTRVECRGTVSPMKRADTCLFQAPHVGSWAAPCSLLLCIAARAIPRVYALQHEAFAPFPGLQRPLLASLQIVQQHGHAGGADLQQWDLQR